MGRPTGKRIAVKTAMAILKDPAATIDQKLAAIELIQKMSYAFKPKKKEKKKKGGLLG